MIKEVKKTIKEYHMISKGDNILIGLSGGADSVALLYILNECKKEYDINIAAVHINHMLRGDDAVKDKEFSKKLCNSLEIPFYWADINVKEYCNINKVTIEEGARIVRYNEFNKICSLHGYNKIAVAHNLNDNAETVIMRLCRGTGIKGLTGILPIRDNIIRPLIQVDRKSIEKYLELIGASYITDKSNNTTFYTRNKIRLNLLPILEEINPKTVLAIGRTSNILKEDEIILEELITQKHAEALNNDNVSLNIKILIKNSEPINKKIIRKHIEFIGLSLKDISYGNICDIISLINKKSNKEIHVSGKLIVQNKYDNIYFDVNNIDKKASLKGYSYLLTENKEIFVKEANKVFYFTKENIEKKYNSHCIISFNYDKIVGNIFIRSRKEKDKIYIKSMGGNKKIGNYFTDNKIDKKLRDIIPLIGTDTEVIAICDNKHIVNDNFKPYIDTNEKAVNTIYLHFWEANCERKN